MTTSIFLLDEELRVVYLNESAEVLIKDSSSRVCGKFIGSIAGEPVNGKNASIIHACQKCLRDGARVRALDLELSLFTSRETRKVDCFFHTLTLEGRDMVCMEVVERSQAGMLTVFSEPHNSRQTVVRGLAHEIRNPLGGIRGAAQLLANELEDRSLREYTDIIVREADRLSRLVSQMQATVTMKELKPTNVHLILEHVRKLVESDPDQKLQFITDYDPSLPDILCDGDQLIQAFLNIVRNAIDAVSELGEEANITLRSRIDRHILSTRDHQQVIRIDVQDNGRGIDPDILEHMFEPMVTNRPSGTGLGLSITEEIVHAHSGVVSAKSEPGWTVFSVFLPVVQR